MAKLTKIANRENDYTFMCPGCGFLHLFDSRWTFNRNFEKPTFSPSLLYRGEKNGGAPGSINCHLYLTDGKIQFLSDCEHALAGQTVDMVDDEELQ